MSMSCCLRATASGCLIGLEAPIMTPNGVTFLFFSFNVGCCAGLVHQLASTHRRPETKIDHPRQHKRILHHDLARLCLSSVVSVVFDMYT